MSLLTNIGGHLEDIFEVEGEGEGFVFRSLRKWPSFLLFIYTSLLGWLYGSFLSISSPILLFFIFYRSKITAPSWPVCNDIIPDSNHYYLPHLSEFSF